MSNIETRSTVGAVELRAGADNTPRKMGGYAAKFGKTSRNLGGFVETIDPRFFNKSAGDGWPGVMARWNHDNAYLLGTSDAATLRLAIDTEGLDYEIDPPDTTYAHNLAVLLERGDVQKSSFAFQVFDEDWALNEDGFPMRTLLSGRLVDVAPVNDPAYMDTTSGLRHLAEMRSVDLADVEAMAKAGELRKLIETPPVVIDLGTPKTPDPDGQSNPHPLLSVRLRRAELLKRRTP